MADLDSLRPEVREALVTVFAMLPYGQTQDKWRLIRAELLALTDRVQHLTREMYATGDTYDVMRTRVGKTEAELAALKARIAESAHVDVTLGCAIDGEIPPDLALCKVALVKVEE